MIVRIYSNEEVYDVSLEGILYACVCSYFRM